MDGEKKKKASGGPDKMVPHHLSHLESTCTVENSDNWVPMSPCNIYCAWTIIPSDNVGPTPAQTRSIAPTMTATLRGLSIGYLDKKRSSGGG